MTLVDFSMTPHRTKILTTLLEQGGEIVDEGGMCTTLLMVATGHRTSNALSGVLLALEDAGLIERDKAAGRRTYRIGLTGEGRRLAEGLNHGAPRRAAPLVRPVTRVAPMADVDAEFRRLQTENEMLKRVVLNQSEALRTRQ